MKFNAKLRTPTFLSFSLLAVANFHQLSVSVTVKIINSKILCTIVFGTPSVMVFKYTTLDQEIVKGWSSNVVSHQHLGKLNR